jgi:hypothetical protein
LQDWVVLDGAEKAEWLRAVGRKRTAPHAFTGKVRHWPYCRRCGLVLLKNEASRLAARKQCEWEE